MFGFILPQRYNGYITGGLNTYYNRVTNEKSVLLRVAKRR